jgi:hypothetical protein
MHVVVGRTPLEEHEYVQLQYAIGNRITVLEKARKANEAANLPTREADADIETCAKLKRLFSPAGNGAEEARRTQADLFTGRPSQPIDDVLDDADVEAARQIRRREIVRAIGGTMGYQEEYIAPVDGEWSDAYLRDLIFDEFEGGVEHLDADESLSEATRTWPDIYRHTTADGTVVWCGVDTEGAVERFWYDIDPTTSWRELAPTLIGDALVPYLREAWGIAETESAAAETVVLNSETKEDQPETPEQWAQRIRPLATPGTTIDNAHVLQVLHSLLLGTPEGAEFWFSAHGEQRTNRELADSIALQWSWATNGKKTYSGTETFEAEGKEQRISYDVSIDPLRLIVGKGKGRRVLDTDDVILLVRSMLGVDAVEESTLTAVAGE